MNNLRYLTTVLALVNAGLTAQAAGAPATSGTTSTGKATTNRLIVGSD